jgi:AraC-like DNA-binding protein
VIPAYVHLRRAKDEIDRRFAEPLDVAALARTALASEAHFARSFKRAFGETPMRYVQRRRIERAADLLRETERPVTQVALEVGFTSIGSFGTAFRALMGEPPSAYRDRHRGAPPPQVPACFTLLVPRPPMMDAEAAEQVKALVSEGAMGNGVFATDDCRRTYEELTARGVEFLQEPAERFYGIEATFRDNSGNWFTQRTEAAQGPA